MICKCKLPIIRGYEPDCYCLKCGLKLKNKKMKKIKDVIQLKKGYKYLSETGNFATPESNWTLTKRGSVWTTNSGGLKFSETTIRENPELFEDVYEEPERKKICVEIEYDVEKGDEYKMDSSGIQTALTRMDNCYVKELNIKVTEIKLLTKEDAEWFYKKNYCSFKSAWAEFQAKKEAGNG